MTANVELQEALDFHAFFMEFQTKKQINWSDYEGQLRVIMDRFFEKPGCKEHLEQFDVSFANLSPDIAHDVIELINDPSLLKTLTAVNGVWGSKASNRNSYMEHPDYCWSSTVITSATSDGIWYTNRWYNCLSKAPKLYGKLHLEDICSFSFNSLYKKLNPVFDDLALKHHRWESHSEKAVAPLRALLLKQIATRTLRKLHIELNADLQLERELLAFCLSDRFEFLFWDCAPLSPDFLTQLFSTLKNKPYPFDRKTRRIKGFFLRSSLKEIVQTLNLKFVKRSEEPEDDYKSNGSDEELERFKKFEREECCLAAEDCSLSVVFSYKDNARVAFCIEFKLCDVDNVASLPLPAEMKTKEETDEENAEFVGDYDDTYYVAYGPDDDCSDSDDSDYDYDDTDCCLKVMRQHSSKYVKEEDCEDCSGCYLCKPDAFVWSSDYNDYIERYLMDG